MDPRFVHVPEIFSLESCTLWHVLAFLQSPFAGGYLCFPVSISSPESTVAVPTIPMCLLNFLLTELVTSASGLSSLAEYGCCLKIYCAAGLRRRSGKVCLRTGLLPELSAQRSCVQETFKRYINLSARAPFPGFLMESLLQGKWEARKKWGNVFQTLSLDWHVAFLPGHHVTAAATPAGLTL